MILVQFIETTWYKNERGARHGTLKNKLPVAARLPQLPVGAAESAFVLHTLKLLRTSPEHHENVALRNGGSLDISCVHVESTERGALVRFTWDYLAGGEPVRWQTGKQVWELGEGQWCRIRFNGRRVLESTWLYHTTTVNVGVKGHPDAAWFLDTTPAYQKETLVDLF